MDKVFQINKYYVCSLLIILLFSSILVLWTATNGELFGVDTQPHVMTGVFFTDFLNDHMYSRGFKPIYDYIWNYYAQYSVLGLLHWPPFFHVVEGIFFYFTGISEFNGRILIYIFFIVGLLYYFKLIYYLYDINVAFLASIFYITSPIILYSARIITLEIPSLSLCIIATYYFILYLENHRFRIGLLACLFTSLALLTKQTSGYLIPFFVLCLVYIYRINKNDKIINFYHIIAFSLIIFIIVAPYYIVALKYHASVISKDVLRGTRYESPFLSIYNYLYYIITLNDQLPLLSILGLILYCLITMIDFRTILSKSNVYLLIWAFCCFILFTIIAQKFARYIIYWVPALCGLSAFAFIYIFNKIASYLRLNHYNVFLVLAISIITVFSGFQAFYYPQPSIRGYDDLAKYILSKIPEGKEEIVLYDGYDYGNMAFSLRKFDPQRRIYLFRTSKFFYSAAITKEYGVWSFIDNKAQIIEFLKKYCIKYIIVSHRSEKDIQAAKEFQSLINDNNVVDLIGKFKITANYTPPNYSGEIRIYSFKGATDKPLNNELEIPMPSMGKTIKIKLN